MIVYIALADHYQVGYIGLLYMPYIDACMLIAYIGPCMQMHAVWPTILASEKYTRPQIIMPGSPIFALERLC
jgi:hypothetical protein